MQTQVEPVLLIAFKTGPTSVALPVGLVSARAPDGFHAVMHTAVLV